MLAINLKCIQGKSNSRTKEKNHLDGRKDCWILSLNNMKWFFK